MQRAKIGIVGTSYRMQGVSLFMRYGRSRYIIEHDLDKCDAICLMGGEDINPAIYGEKPLSNVYFNPYRDKLEVEAVEKAVEAGKFLIGICRGAQLLNCVPNGGTLWQDVDKHSGHHSIFDCTTGRNRVVNSIHHQMMRPTARAEVLAYATESTTRKAEGQEWRKQRYAAQATVLEKDKDPEVLWYPETRSLCAQFHPEFDPAGESGEYFMDLMDRYYWLREPNFKWEEAA